MAENNMPVEAEQDDWWATINNMLANPNIQKGMADFGRSMSMGRDQYGQPMEGVGSLLAGTASNTIKAQQFREQAEKETLTRGLFQKGLLKLLGQNAQEPGNLLGMLQGTQQPQTVQNMPQNESKNWIFDEIMKSSGSPMARRS